MQAAGSPMSFSHSFAMDHATSEKHFLLDTGGYTSSSTLYRSRSFSSHSDSASSMIPAGFTIDKPTMVPEQATAETDDAVSRKIAGESFYLKKPVDPAQFHSGKRVRFSGLFVVQSPTQPRHIRYAMEIYSQELNLQFRCTQRFSSFYLLRKRMLKALKQCQVSPYRPTFSESMADMDFHQLMKQPCCAGCSVVRKKLKSVPFPHRALFTTADVVENRSPMLEAFLDACVNSLVAWEGCERGKKFFCVVLGKFLGVNLIQHIFQRPPEVEENPLDNQVEAVETNAV